MTQQMVKRLHVVQQMHRGVVSASEASQVLDLSVRQVWRIKKRVGEEGVRGLVHGNTGRCPPNRLDDALRERIRELATGPLRMFNDSHCTEKLVAEHGILTSRETVRRLRRKSGQEPKQRRRYPKHRSRRERRAHVGAMMLWDGSHHPWFGNDEPRCCLMAAIDDATSQIVAAHFCEAETSEAYLRLLLSVVRTHGIPLAVYQDRHGALSSRAKKATIEEQIRGDRQLTQVGKALQRLAIKPIFSMCPQGKGRIERLFRTLQDRLLAELEYARIRTLKAANAFLATYVTKHNAVFGCAPRDATSAWLPIPKGLDLNHEIAFQYEATVGSDNAVRLEGIILDIPADRTRRSFARAKVDVRQHLDGSWVILRDGQQLARYARTPVAEPIAVPRPRADHLKGLNNETLIYPAQGKRALVPAVAP